MTLADFVGNLGIVLYPSMSGIAHFGGVWPDIIIFLDIRHHLERYSSS